MSELDLDLDSASIRAEQIIVRLDHAHCASPEDQVGRVSSVMEDAQFDAAPVMSGGKPVGVFFRGHTLEPETPVSEVMRPLDASLIVAGHTGLEALLTRMCAEPFLFVLEEQGVTGFVTPADLAAVPVRTHFYLRLAYLETALGKYLRARFPDQSEAIRLLNDTRRQAQARVADELREKDSFIDDLSCLSLLDLVHIAGEDRDFRSAVAATGVGWGKAKHGLAGFRDDVMHPTRTLGGGVEGKPGRLLDRQRRIDALIRVAHAAVGEGGPGESAT